MSDRIIARCFALLCAVIYFREKELDIVFAVASDFLKWIRKGNNE